MRKYAPGLVASLISRVKASSKTSALSFCHTLAACCQSDVCEDAKNWGYSGCTGLRWHIYEPNLTASSLKQFLKIVRKIHMRVFWANHITRRGRITLAGHGFATLGRCCGRHSPP